MARENCSITAVAVLASATCSGHMLVAASHTLVVLETVREKPVCNCSLAAAKHGLVSMQHNHLAVLE